ncbi:hypothetical protein ABTU92_30230, partial [Rhodoplanes sp. SY1]
HCNGDFAAPTADRDPVAPPDGRKPDSRRPTGLVAPPVVLPPPPRPLPPRLVCIGGTVRAGACTCPATWRPMKAGATTMRCVATAPVHPRPLGPTVVTGRPKLVGPQPLVRPGVGQGVGVGSGPRPGFAGPARASLAGPRPIR